MKQKFIDYYMDVAERTSNLSYAIRLQVGAVIVKDNRILSYGYNGMPAGWDNDCEEKVWDKGAGGWLDSEEFEAQYPFEGWHEGAGRNVRYGLKTKPEVLHAESNAIAKVSGSTESSQDATMFCTHAPCIHCAKMIWQSGIKNLYYRDTYRDSKGVEFLEKSGVNVYKHTGSTQNSN
jgi:dCMP deaminase